MVLSYATSPLRSDNVVSHGRGVAVHHLALISSHPNTAYVNTLAVFSNDYPSPFPLGSVAYLFALS